MQEDKRSEQRSHRYYHFQTNIYSCLRYARGRFRHHKACTPSNPTSSSSELHAQTSDPADFFFLMILWLKSPTGRLRGKSTAARSWANSKYQPRMQKTKTQAPLACETLAVHHHLAESVLTISSCSNIAICPFAARK